jgi:hypothetical protein
MATLRLSSSHPVDGFGERLLHGEKVFAAASQMPTLPTTPNRVEGSTVARAGQEGNESASRIWQQWIH